MHPNSRHLKCINFPQSATPLWRRNSRGQGGGGGVNGYLAGGIASTHANQLPAFVGAQKHFDMRRDVEAKEGAAFDLKRYHDRVLAQGAPPVRFARQLILGEPIR